MSFTGFYRVLPGFTEFYRVLSGFAEFYRVLPGFSGLDGFRVSTFLGFL